MTAMEDLRANKLAVVIIAAVVGSGAWFFLSPSSVACNSSELLDEFQNRFKDAKAKIMAHDQYGKEHFANHELNIKSTTTLGKDGNMTSCQMSWDYTAEGTNSYTDDYRVGRNDKGELVWQFQRRAPYALSYYMD